MTEYERTKLIQQPLRPPYLADTLIISQDASKTEIKYLITDINFNASGNRPLKMDINALIWTLKISQHRVISTQKIILITHLRSILVKQKKSSQKKHLPLSFSLNEHLSNWRY